MPDPRKTSVAAPVGSDESGTFPEQDAMFNNLIARTLTVLSSSPYNVSAPAGGIQAGTALFTGPPSGAATVLGVQVGSGYTGLLLDLKDPATVSRFTVDYAGTATCNGQLNFDAIGTANQIQLTGVTGVNGRRLSIQSLGASGSAEVQLVPGPSAVTGTLNSEILMMNVQGTNYERFTLAANQSQYQIDSTYNGTGVARPMWFQIGGSVSNAINSEPAIIINSDASVDIQGTAYSAQGKSWGTTRARISDQTNVGDVRLGIYTRTGTPTDVAADDAVIEFGRGGARKWAEGLNFGGSNVDSFDWYSTAVRMSLTQAGLLKLPAAAATTTGAQINGASTLRSGTGIPSNAIGADGDYFFRSDGGGAGATHLYYRNAGAYIGVA